MNNRASDPSPNAKRQSSPTKPEFRLPRMKYKGTHPFAFPSYNQFTNKETKKLDDEYLCLRYDNAALMLGDFATPIPSLEEMKKEVKAPLTIQVLNERIEKEKADHKRHLQVLEDRFRTDLERMCVDQWLSIDDCDGNGIGQPPLDQPERTTERLMALFVDETRLLEHNHDDFKSRLVFAHEERLVALRSQVRELQKAAAEEMKRKASQFPKTVADFDALPNGPMKMRVVRWLMADSNGREKIFREPNSVWHSLDTQELALQYMIDNQFRVRVQNLKENNRGVDPRVRAQES
ncbi:hypothetical protein SISSUDRAFT_1057858 [Sistotremastrum suecicum HHB10207 ss-3]|uniref:Uncharacterized protein n=1 Tax=Sistotremastrum suecicum HHB10207 ss-3 TaxID=1314776 RepID=A0A166HU40_9AGAM|nr:hypothetical protein SISSUDRAFT_1057858 [Sistotremastrum suecicum HHB10207 ss-3]